MKYIYTLLIGVCSVVSAIGQIQIEGSFLNITRPGGGSIYVGDVLEIRAIISVSSGTGATSLRYLDNVPANTTFVSGSLRVLTNEGLIIPAIPNTGAYTDASGDDRGRIAGSNILINMGTGATNASGGAVTGGSTTPVFYNVASILMAAYRVTVTGAPGSTITLAGSFSYKDPSTGTTLNPNLTTKTLVISPPYTCTSLGSTNFITAESNGTFGSGTTHNRTTASSNVTGYLFQNITTGAPIDAQYSIVKNSSPTQYTGASPAGSDKVFSAWDIYGDHTGTSTTAGNPPAANGVSGGYMLLINATYAPAVVFTTTVSGLAVNTNYTVSFWLRNICPTCANDPATGASVATPGVPPNVSIELNGRTYYSSGNIIYNNQWVQKSFTFNSGAVTSFSVAIRNNSPGGGGNDWAIDDLRLTTCLIILPVKLAAFQGSLQANSTLLNWRTEAEAKADHFTVERSTDGAQFFPIGKVKATNSTTGSNYGFTDDALPASDHTYYRLQIVDKDGYFNYSNIISVRRGDEEAAAIRLWPNPSKGNSTLYITAEKAGTATVSIINTAGASVYRQHNLLSAGQNFIVLQPAQSLTAGIYLVKVVMNNKAVNTRLVIE